MYSRSPRILTAILLGVCLWTSAIASVAAPLPQQAQDQKKTEQKETKEQKTPAATTAKNTGKPLSTNEDPTKIGKRKINSGLIPWMSGSLEKEVAFGREIAAEVERQTKLIDDPVITEYVNRVGQNIVLHSDAKVPFTIKVIDSDELNAFALPGGFFYVNKGLILAADNEAELAGAMAHEIAHVAARHVMENMARVNLTQYGMLAGAILFGLPPILYDAASLGASLGFLKFSRNAESEADTLGVQYMYAAGYDPNAMATMFEKLLARSKKKPGTLTKLFSTHPQPPDRRAATVALVARFPERDEYVVSTSEFQRVKGRLLRLSNARATTAGDISGGNDGQPGRPTLKRRQPTPDDPNATPTPNSDDKSSEEKKPAGPPKLKRNTEANPPATSPQPSATP